MTKELQKEHSVQKPFLRFAHEIRNHSLHLRASELLDKTEKPKDRSKLFEIINHDVRESKD